MATTWLETKNLLSNMRHVTPCCYVVTCVFVCECVCVTVCVPVCVCEPQVQAPMRPKSK